MANEKELRRAMNHARRTGDGELYQDLEAQLAELEAERRAFNEAKNRVFATHAELFRRLA